MIRMSVWILAIPPWCTRVCAHPMTAMTWSHVPSAGRVVLLAYSVRCYYLYRSFGEQCKRCVCVCVCICSDRDLVYHYRVYVCTSTFRSGQRHSRRIRVIIIIWEILKRVYMACKYIQLELKKEEKKDTYQSSCRSRAS